ncbi:MAG TPA: DMT family transporter [Candidatus Limnocylindrales bacterium]|nr:DMT family transporter [Candidatus Limnocylindrales bacterium]
MTWVLYSVLAGMLFTAGSLLSRHILKAEKDPWAYSFWFSLGGALACFPLMLISPQVPTGWWPWALALVLGIGIVAHNVLQFTALRYIEASVSGSIMKLRLVWVFILGALFLGEVTTPGKMLGIVLTLAAAFLIFYKFKHKNSTKGILLVLGASVLNAGIIILIKYLLDFFNPVSLTFFGGFLFSAIFNFILMPRSFERITDVIKNKGKIIFLSAGLGGITNLIMYKALEVGDTTRVVVIIEAFLITTLAGESLFLREKHQVGTKIVAVLLATFGAILITITV